MSKDIFDSIDQAIEINEKLSSENNRLTMALQDIREYINLNGSLIDLDILGLIRGATNEALEGEK